LAISIERPDEVQAEVSPRAAAARARASMTARGVVFVVGATAFVVGAGLFSLSRSALFGLRHLEVSASGHRSATELRARADLREGTNVVWLDTGSVERRLEADPWIARATVTRSLPWTVRIRVVERTPVAIVDGGRHGTYVAADGARLGPAAASSALPRISLPPAAPATVGVPGEDGAIRALAALSPAVRHRVRTVQVVVGGTLTLRLRMGTVVLLGDASQLDQKARALRRLLAWERSSGAKLSRISLVAPTAPAASLAA
jgi:cell division protein FtsQ